MHTLQDYDYVLPSELIAQNPADPPESCKFLVYTKNLHVVQDQLFSDISTHIDPDTLMICNNTKVVKARIAFDKKEIFFLRKIDTYTFEALVYPGKKFKIGSAVHITTDIYCTVKEITYTGRILTSNKPIEDILETLGQMPLPPYITYDQTKSDPYQPIFAEKKGSVAAPTASLHFSQSLLDELQNIGVDITYTTLHVGLGTFKQVDVNNIQEYDIHDELCTIDYTLFERIAQQKINKKPVLAIGTTVTRTLESLPYVWKTHKEQFIEKYIISDRTIQFREMLTSSIPYEQAKLYILSTELGTNNIHFSTKLFLYPGKPFYIIDELITNFHLPKSSLLMLVAAFIGYDEMNNIYAHAIEHTYKFYSFGDAMWLKHH